LWTLKKLKTIKIVIYEKEIEGNIKDEEIN